MNNIEWTDESWNPVTGCTPVSAGCDHCYAKRMAKRLEKMQPVAYANGFKVTCHPERLDIPLHWKKPRMIFVCSMGDLFHKDVSFGFIKRVIAVMNQCPQHTFQVLTKRAERLPVLARQFEAIATLRPAWRARQLRRPGNVWLGTSVENQDHLDRVDYLRNCPAAVRFVSIEPMLGAMPDLNLDGIHWVIVGGESGPGARPMDLGWARSIRDQCRAAGVLFFMKQLGSAWARKHGLKGKGNNMADWPEDLRIREMPETAKGMTHSTIERRE